jgi:hypothetical protein
MASIEEKDNMKQRMATFIREGGSYVELCEEFIDEAEELLPVFYHEMRSVLDSVRYLSVLLEVD